jgi:hypothetical protein
MGWATAAPYIHGGRHEMPARDPTPTSAHPGIRPVPALPRWAIKESAMFVLKACPRCHGDLNGGLDGEFTCIQCGYELKPEERARMAARIRLAQRAARTRVAA